MPLTSFRVSSNDFSGQMRPSKPSGMPITFHPYLMMAALVAARMTALRPGASPPPVPMPIQRMLDIGKIVVGREQLAEAAAITAALYDNTGTAEAGNLPVGMVSVSDTAAMAHTDHWNSWR